MNSEDVSEILLLALRFYRAQAGTVGETTAKLQALYEMIGEHDPESYARLQGRTDELMREDADTMLPMLRALDEVIRRLESQRPPRVN